jgi:integrase
MLRRLRRIKVYVTSEGDRRQLRMYYRDPLTGRMIRRSAGTTRMAEAQREAARWEDEINANRQNYGGLTWEEFRAKFTDEHLAGKSQNTQSNFCHALNRFERDCGLPVDIREITGTVLSSWQRKLAASGLSPASVASNLRCMKVALNWATKIGLLQTAPRVMMPVGSSSRGRPVTLLEFVRFLRAVPVAFSECPDNALRLSKGLWLSGLRLDEALRLSWPDGVGQGDPIVHLAGFRYPCIQWPVGSHKARKADLTPIPPDLTRFLARESNRIGRVFPMPLAPKTIGKRLSHAGRLAKVRVSNSKFLSAHDLRRTFGNRWALRVHPLVLRAMMRHTSMETTLRYYVDLRLDQLGEALWGGSQTGSQTQTELLASGWATPEKRGKNRD